MSETSKEKVFGVGFSKTGTTSIERAFEILGYKVCKGHWNNNLTNFLCASYKHNDIEEIMNITSYFDAFADGPWGGGNLYPTLTKSYPDAYFVHSIRDTDEWWESFRNMFLRIDSNPKTAMSTARSLGWYGSYAFFTKIFETDDLSEDNSYCFKQYYDKYNQDLSMHLRNSGVKALTLDVTTDKLALEKLIEFLELQNKVTITMRNGKIKTYEQLKGRGILRMPHMNKKSNDTP